jgi:dCTP deaminase
MFQMSVLSDKTLKQLCVPPTHMYCNPRGFDEIKIAPPFTAAQQKAVDNLCHLEGRIENLNHETARRLTDKELAEFTPMIVPFVQFSQKTNEFGAKILSKGLSSFGYDVSLSASDLKLFTNINAAEIDPSDMDERCFVSPVIKEQPDTGRKYVLVPPNSYLLGFTEQTFNIPRNILVVCLGKSTMARAGCIVNVTPIEPGFKGTVVIELSNSTTLPMRVYLEEGISQFIFLKGDLDCGVSYADRDGKYQNQYGLVHAKV